MLPELVPRVTDVALLTMTDIRQTNTYAARRRSPSRQPDLIDTATALAAASVTADSRYNSTKRRRSVTRLEIRTIEQRRPGTGGWTRGCSQRTDYTYCIQNSKLLLIYDVLGPGSVQSSAEKVFC